MFCCQLLKVFDRIRVMFSRFIIQAAYRHKKAVYKTIYCVNRHRELLLSSRLTIQVNHSTRL